VSAALAAAVLATTVRLMASHAYAEGAPPGFSGGFKEESCHACHFHEEPNSGGGRLTIEGVPAKFEAGQRYTLTVALTRAGMKRAGFQLAARFKDGGAQAGTLAPGPGEGERVKVESSSGVQYAGQKKAGSLVADDVARWTLVWTAPERGGPVIFHAAANAADGNESADGDFVYTADLLAVLDAREKLLKSSLVSGYRTRRADQLDEVRAVRRFDHDCTKTEIRIVVACL
jgi:hypothetical protein